MDRTRLRVLLWFDAGPLLSDEANDVARRSTDLQLLEAAGEQAGVTPVGSAQLEDVSVRVVPDVQLERPGGPTEDPGAALRLLPGLVDVLAQHVLDLVFVCRLEVVAQQSSGRLQRLQPLLYNKLVYHGQVFQT